MTADQPPPDLVSAWLTAAEELKIDVQAPFVAGDGRIFAALIAGFGSAKGTLVDWLGREPHAGSSYPDYFLSQVNAEVYSDFQRETFQEALRDWGWALDGEAAPAWYAEPPDALARDAERHPTPIDRLAMMASWTGPRPRFGWRQPVRPSSPWSSPARCRPGWPLSCWRGPPVHPLR